MSSLFVYICTKQTVASFVPAKARSIDTLSRDVSDAIYAMQGGHLTVGKLAFLPLQKSLPFHLLCDGREVAKADFPELYEFLGDFMGTPVDPDNFVLPSYIGEAALAPAAVAAPETTAGGTVTSESSSPGTGTSGGSTDYAVDSGGRNKEVLYFEP